MCTTPSRATAVQRALLRLFFSLKLIQFERFEDNTHALAAGTATVEGKLSKPLKKLLKQLVNPDAPEKLLVADAALGKSIKVSDAVR